MRGLRGRGQDQNSASEYSAIFKRMHPALEVQDGLAGSVIGDRYRIIQRLGSGGFGKVYLATDKKTQSLVAIKLMSSFCVKESPSGNGIFDMSEYFRFAREAEASGMINNKNVVKVLDFGIFNGTPFIVMEYLKGADLKSELTNLRIIPWNRCRSITLQVCNGLKYIHDLGLVHRDVKPSNIFLCQEDGEERAKLIDLGLVKFKDNARNLEDSDEIVGTPAYMAPEMLDSSLPCDHRMDIYSLGATIYEMLAGQPPFKARNYVELMLMHRESVPRPIRLGADAPQGLNTVIQKALMKRPDDRYSSIDEFKAAIESLKLERTRDSMGFFKSALNWIRGTFSIFSGFDFSISFNEEDLSELYKRHR